MAPEISNANNSNQLRNSSSFPPSMTHISHGPTQHTPSPMPTPPPLPPRRPAQAYSLYNDRPFGSNYYGNYGNYGYGTGYRSYSGYNFLGSQMPYSDTYNYRYIDGQNIESRFQQYAEENTRSTFHVIETVLHTFSSITTVLESTYFALTNSFRAILNVAENVGKLRSTIGYLLSTLSFLRFLKWIYKKIIFILGYQRQDAINESLWDETISQATNGKELYSTSSTWSNFLLLAAFVVIPYLIHKISSNVKQMQIQVNDPKSWLTCKDPVQVAYAMYNFQAASSEELNLKIGQKIWLAPQSIQSKSMPGWYLVTDSKNVGLVPANYIRITGQLIKTKSENDKNTVASSQSLLPSMDNSIAPEQEMTDVNMPESRSVFYKYNSSENDIEDNAVLQFK